MYSFLILGIIPGTDIQITFTLWCLISGVIATVIYVYKLSGIKSVLNSFTKNIDFNKPSHQ